MTIVHNSLSQLNDALNMSYVVVHEWTRCSQVLNFYYTVDYQYVVNCALSV